MSTKEKWEHLRNQLLELREILHRQVERVDSHGLENALGESIQELSVYDNHPADIGSETFEREKDLGLRDNAKLILSKIEEALKKIDQGTYNTCDICGRPIGMGRLEALPYATTCVRCQAKEEERDAFIHRPVEESLLTPPFTRTSLVNTENPGTDGEDVWREVAKYGTGDDIPGGEDYDWSEADEPSGIVEGIEEITNEDVPNKDSVPSPKGRKL